MLFMLCILFFALCTSTYAQSASMARVGILFGASAHSNLERLQALRERLRDLGYIEAKNLLLEQRYADGKLDRLPALAAELVSLKLDIVVSGAAAATRSLKQATTTIPIVMAQDSDPVGNKFIESLSKPGGNITGLSTLSPELNGKRVELLKEIVPKLRKLAFFGTSTNAGNAQTRSETERAAQALEIHFQYHDMLEPRDIQTAFQQVTRDHTDGCLVAGGPMLNSHQAELLALAIDSRLPVIYNAREFVNNGGLMSYGVSFSDLYRRAAVYVGKVLKGARPADLPVEQPTKFELVINLKTAKQIGLMIPPNVLARADRVIR
jgi:putative tryptophan/tyrosine transport system substrate-binding protein